MCTHFCALHFYRFQLLLLLSCNIKPFRLIYSLHFFFVMNTWLFILKFFPSLHHIHFICHCFALILMKAKEKRAMKATRKKKTKNKHDENLIILKFHSSFVYHFVENFNATKVFNRFLIRRQHLIFIRNHAKK